MGFDFVSLVLGGLMTLIAPPAPPAASAPPSGLLTRRVTVGATSYSYQVYVPEGASRREKLPVVLFLHGIGQRARGRLCQPQRRSVLIKGYWRRCRRLSCCRSVSESLLVTRSGADGALAADAAATEFGGDTERMSVVAFQWRLRGWHLAAPGKFAAIVPICGVSRAATATASRPSRGLWPNSGVGFSRGGRPHCAVSESRQMVAP